MENKNSDNKNVLIIQNSDEKKSDGMTLSKYGHYVAKYKYFIAIITLLFAIIGYLFASLYYNPSKSTLTSSFTLNLPFIIEKTTSITSNGEQTSDKTIKYLDGSKFSYQDIISRGNVESVIKNTKSENDENSRKYTFSIDKLVEKNALSIEEKTIKNDNKIEILTNSYIITAKTKYIGNKDAIAKEFIKDLIENIKKTALQKVESTSINSYLPDSTTSYDYSITLDALINQYDAINNFYSASVNSFSGSILTSDNKTTIQQKQTVFVNKYASSSTTTYLDDLKSEYIVENYIAFDKENIDSEITRIEEAAKKAANSLASIQVDIKNKNEAIEKYVNAFGDKEAVYSKTFEEYVADLQKLRDKEKELTALVTRYGYADNANYIAGSVLDHLKKAKTSSEPEWEAKNAEFVNKLNSYYSQIKTDLNSANDEYHYLYKTYENDIVYDSIDVGVITSGINAFLVALIFLVLGYLISSFTFYGIGISADKKVLTDNANTNSTPVKLKNEPVDVKIESENDETF